MALSKADLAFDDLRRVSLQRPLGFPSEYGDTELRNRICRNLIRFTNAPYCAAVLSYIGMDDEPKLWAELGDEALQLIHDGEIFDYLHSTVDMLDFS